MNDVQPPEPSDSALPVRMGAGARERWVFVVLVGVVVSCLSIVATWQVNGRFYGYRLAQHTTMHWLEFLVEELEKYRREHGVFPDELTLLWPEEGYRLTDSWGRPFLYRVHDDGYELYSLGRDGVPGGVGRDADLTPESRELQKALPLLQFLSSERGIGWPVIIALVAGLATSLCAALTLRRARRDETSLPPLFTVVGFGVVTIVVGWILAWFHIPTGH